MQKKQFYLGLVLNNISNSIIDPLCITAVWVFALILESTNNV
jgi:hypothetical protein